MTEHQQEVEFLAPTAAEEAIHLLGASQNIYLKLSAITGAAATALIGAGFLVDHPAVKGALMLTGFLSGMASMAAGTAWTNEAREIDQIESQYEWEGPTVQN